MESLYNAQVNSIEGHRPDSEVVIGLKLRQMQVGVAVSIVTIKKPDVNRGFVGIGSLLVGESEFENVIIKGVFRNNKYFAEVEHHAMKRILNMLDEVGPPLKDPNKPETEPREPAEEAIFLTVPLFKGVALADDASCFEVFQDTGRPEIIEINIPAENGEEPGYMIATVMEYVRGKDFGSYFFESIDEFKHLTKDIGRFNEKLLKNGIGNIDMKPDTIMVVQQENADGSLSSTHICYMDVDLVVLKDMPDYQNTKRELTLAELEDYSFTNLHSEELQNTVGTPTTAHPLMSLRPFGIPFEPKWIDYCTVSRWSFVATMFIKVFGFIPYKIGGKIVAEDKFSITSYYQTMYQYREISVYDELLPFLIKEEELMEAVRAKLEDTHYSTDNDPSLLRLVMNGKFSVEKFHTLAQMFLPEMEKLLYFHRQTMEEVEEMGSDEFMENLFRALDTVK